MKDNINPLEEKVCFFPDPGKRNLFGFIHYARSPSNQIGIVFCHPFADEKNMSHSVVVKTARIFAAEGFPVFRFDFSGCGDSKGVLQSSSLLNWLQDLDTAITVFRKETGISKCLLWGIRFGAGLSLLYEHSRKNIAGLILWQPVLDFSVYIRQFLRRTIYSQISKGMDVDISVKAEENLHCNGRIHVMGYPVTKKLYDSFNNLVEQPVDVIPSVPVFILSISLMEQPNSVLKKYTDSLKEASLPVLLQHVTAEPFWDRNWRWECEEPIEATLRWLQKLG